MKKRNIVLVLGIVGALMAGCGQNQAKEVESVTLTQEAESKDGGAETDIQIKETITAETTETETEQNQEENKQGGYEDNFAVESETAAEFGRLLKEIVAEKDIEKLADAMAFPVYVGFKDGGLPVKTREEFIALGAEKIFTAELLDSIAESDETGLKPSMAGFSLSKESGTPNIIFGVRDGELAVSGINY